MKYFRLIILFALAFAAVSCQDDEKERIAETLRTQKQNDSILKIISSNWRFNIAPATPKVQGRISTWNEWQQFRNELLQKPTGTLGSYRQKTKNLVNKADELRKNIPFEFNKPQVRSRLGVLVTKIKSLYTFMSIAAIPDKQVTALLQEITHEVNAVQGQMDEIIRLSEVPKEFGEEEMLRALDTVRMADPDRLPQPGTSTVQPATTKPVNPQVRNKRRQLLKRIN